MIDRRGRIVAIVLDAAEPSLIERFTDEGRLPALRRLREAGSYGRLRSSAEWLAGSPWPTFHSGTNPGEHGLYHFVQWHAEKMTIVRPTPDRLPLQPFWRDFAASGRRVVAIDLSALYRPDRFDGIEITGWHNNDLLAPPFSHPRDLLDRARSEFGVAPMEGEVYSAERPAELLRLRDALLRATARTGDLAVSLVQREAFDLFMVCLAATHRGGHKLWDASAARGDVADHERAELSTALLRVYAACDDVVGRVVAAAGNGATVLVLSLHGMGPNTSRVLLVPEMLRRILGGPEVSAQPGLLKELRQRIPIEWRNAVKNRLPRSMQDRLTVFWRVGGLDMTRTEALPLVADLQGYIRVNLKGREPGGIVEPGAPYERLCARLAAGFLSFRDADSGEPVVDAAVRSDQLYPGAPRLAELPDVILRWSSTPACEHRALVSDRYGTIPWPTPGRHPEGRSGNHRGEGFLLACGAGIPAGGALEDADIVDLAPTLSAWLDLPPRPEWRGKPLAL